MGLRRNVEAVAAILSGHDNGCYVTADCKHRMFNDVPDAVFCGTCGWKTDWTFCRPTFRLGRRRLDVSYTYDGACIISDRARSIIASLTAEANIVRSLDMEPGYFHLIPHDTIHFDVQRRGTRFGTLCNTCRLWSTVAGGSPAFLKSVPAGSKHLFRTDILFGSYNARHPMIVISSELYHRFREARLTGIEMEPIAAAQCTQS